MLRFFGVLFLLAICMVLELHAAETGVSKFNQIVVSGMERSYILYRPAASDNKKMPLMIVLHGGLGNARNIEKTTRMNEIADTEKFLVAYPNGTEGFGLKDRRTWNAGKCCGVAVRKNIDDVRFIDSLIGDIGSKVPLDTRRVYVTGMSNGAMMAYRLAAEIPNRIAAIVPVAGTLAVESFDKAKDIPVLHIHGTDDRNIPIAGGMGDKSVAGVSHRSLSDTVKLIGRVRGCSDPDVARESGGIQVSSYRCSNGAPVAILLIEHGAHVWPGGAGEYGSSGNFSASRKAWDFAKQFSKRE